MLEMERLVLNGKDLTLQAIWEVACEGRQVEIAPEAYGRLAASRQVMEDLAAGGKAIYGFNRGVGWNKDQKFDEDFISEYNKKLMRSHTLGIPPYNTEEEVRAMMVIRLNNLLGGAACSSDGLANRYRDFLNHRITPLIPRRGSVGEDDITTLSHMGLAFIGEEEVLCRGEQMSAAEAIRREGLPEYRLVLKDAHTVILSNAQGEGLTALLVRQTEELMRVCNLVYCLDYEGLNGNIEAMSEEVNAVRGIPNQMRAAAECRGYLEGSYLYEEHPDRALQDALSFRGGFIIHSMVYDALDYIRNLLNIQINSTSDNPCIIPETGQVLVTSNFETGSLAIGVEMLSNAMAHVSRTICYRMIKMADPAFTHLTRFLAPWDEGALGYAQVQDTFTAIDVENRSLVNPSSMDFFPIEGMIEDHGSNLPLVADKAGKLLDNLRYLVGMEALYAAQAVDLRGDLRLGRCTQKAYEAIRREIPFLDRDRNLHRELCAAYELVASGKLLACTE